MLVNYYIDYDYNLIIYNVMVILIVKYVKFNIQ